MIASTPAPSVGFLRHSFLHRSETFVYSSMRNLEESGRYKVRVFATRRVLPERFPWDDITEVHGVARLLYHATRFAPSFRRWARSVRLIHAHLGQTGPFAMAGAAAARIPFVVSYYGHDVVMYRTRERFRPFAWWYTLLRRRVFARASKIVVLSDHMKRALVDQGCPSEKLAIVRLGVDLDRFDVERTPHEGPVRIVMIGREVDKKGFDDGLRACRLLRDRGIECRVTVLGTHGPLEGKLRGLASELGLDVSWPDPSTPAPQVLAASDILLVPSRTAADGDEEGTPTVIVEGSGARLPIVSTRHAGIPEQVEHGATGLLAAERDPAGLADALAQLARDPARRRAMGDAGRARMQREYSFGAHRAALEEVYAEALTDHEKASSR